MRGESVSGATERGAATPFVPGRREAWLCAAAVFALAAIVRAVVAATLAYPVPEDTAYYAGVARNLVEGRGLIADALWSYQTQPLVVPRAAFEVWMPLPTLLNAIPIAIFGPAHWFRAAQIVSVVISSLVAVLAWRLGADVATELRLPVGRARTLAVGSGVVAGLLGPLVVFGALPDSTALFAVLALAACLLMNRITAPAEASPAEASPAESAPPGRTPEPRSPSQGSRLTDGRAGGGRIFDFVVFLRSLPLARLVGLGLLIGLAGLTRSEATWLGLTWLVVAWFWSGTPKESAASQLPARPSRAIRVALVAIPAAVAIAVYAPWAIRDWLTFGSPLPGQTLANALSIHPTDIYAYGEQPTLAGYLAAGPLDLIGMRVIGLFHNLVLVLMIPGFPIGLVGLVMLPRYGRLRAVRPLTVLAVTTFTATTLVFPVSTLWGTFLHAAGPVFVLLTVSCLIAFDALIAVVHRIRHWWRPVAWLGPALAAAVAMPLLAVSVISLDRSAQDTKDRYDQLPPALARAGIDLRAEQPILTDRPVWLAESARVTALALPEESPESVLALAARFHARLVIVTGDADDRVWPGVLEAGGQAAKCFSEVFLTENSGKRPSETSPLGGIRVFRIVCA